MRTQKARTSQVTRRSYSSSSLENKPQRRESKMKKVLRDRDRDRAEEAEKKKLSKLVDPKIERWAYGYMNRLNSLCTMLWRLQQVINPGSIGWKAIKSCDFAYLLRIDEKIDAAFEEATFLLHPYQLEQRGASVELKYVCECVLRFLGDAWHEEQQWRLERDARMADTSA